jgi:hypothetical protein
MIASALNTLLGLWLVYAAVLEPGLLDKSPWTLGVSALALTVLGLWAYRRDYLKWPGATVVVLGLGLLVVVLSGARALADQLTFWVTFWSGVVVGVLSLWSVFYRHESPESGDLPASAGSPEPQL